MGKFLDVEVDFLGSVPYNKNMQRAVMRQAPVSISDPESDSARAVKNIAGCLEDVMTEKTEKGGIVKLFSSVIRMRFMK